MDVEQEYGELLQEAQLGTGGATARFLFVMEHLGKADHEVGKRHGIIYRAVVVV